MRGIPAFFFFLIHFSKANHLLSPSFVFVVHRVKEAVVHRVFVMVRERESTCQEHRRRGPEVTRSRRHDPSLSV